MSFFKKLKRKSQNRQIPYLKSLRMALKKQETPFKTK